MKTLFLTLILTIFLGSFYQVEAQKSTELKVRVGQQKTFSGSKLKIKFLSLVEDSRCPEGVNCVWAGNARIKVKVTSPRGITKIFDMNTNLGPKGDTLDGYAINLESLTPVPKANVKLNKNAYTATFTISRLTR